MQQVWTVRRLREVLALLPRQSDDDLAVWVEGCDCYGPVGGVRFIDDETEPGGRYVLIERMSEESRDE